MAGVGQSRSALGGHRADKQHDIFLEPLALFPDDGTSSAECRAADSI